jgi:hypothetical protein
VLYPFRQIDPILGKVPPRRFVGRTISVIGLYSTLVGLFAASLGVGFPHVGTTQNEWIGC